MEAEYEENLGFPDFVNPKNVPLENQRVVEIIRAKKSEIDAAEGLVNWMELHNVALPAEDTDRVLQRRLRTMNALIPETLILNEAIKRGNEDDIIRIKQLIADYGALVIVPAIVQTAREKKDQEILTLLRPYLPKSNLQKKIEQFTGQETDQDLWNRIKAQPEATESFFYPGISTRPLTNPEAFEIGLTEGSLMDLWLEKELPSYNRVLYPNLLWNDYNEKTPLLALYAYYAIKTKDRNALQKWIDRFGSKIQLDENLLKILRADKNNEEVWDLINILIKNQMLFQLMETD